MSMNTMTTNALRELHQLHLRITGLREQSERGPRQVEAKRKLLAQRNEALEKARAELKSIKVQAHQKETERKAIETRANQLQLQINTAKSNKEYTALVSEKDAAAKIRAAVEDQILEILLREDEKTQEIQITEKEVSRLQQELADVERATSQQSTELTRKLSEAEGRLEAAEASLPKDMRDAYHRLLGRRGADALAEVANSTCTGCYTTITPQTQNQLLLSELVLCKSCGRILYLEDLKAE